MTLIGNPPPALLEVAIEHVVMAAQASTCQKSRRGAVVFDPRAVYAASAVWGIGWNGQPPPMRCDGTCKLDGRCPRLAVHAEQRAIRHALASANSSRSHAGTVLSGFELVHVKVDEHGHPVASGGPSCWQCSREILDVQLDAVWLLQAVEHLPDDAERVERSSFTWRRYTAEEFHAETVKACGLTGPTGGSPDEIERIASAIASEVDTDDGEQWRKAARAMFRLGARLP